MYNCRTYRERFEISIQPSVVLSVAFFMLIIQQYNPNLMSLFTTIPVQNISQAPKIENSARGRTPLPPLNEPFEGRSLPSRRSSGGGHGDFEERTYNCETCSRWFFVDSNGDRNKEGNGGPAYEEYMAKKPQNPQILMHHVSDGCHVTIRIPLIPSLFFSH
jgi:hypothetical protein